MKMKKLILPLLIGFSLLTCAQKVIEPNEADIKQATNLKEKFEKEDVVALTVSKDIVSFGFNEKTKNVTVIHEIEEDLINMDARADIRKYHFYDGQSEISRFKFTYKNKRKTYFKIVDEAYTSNGFFHNDSRVKYADIDFPLKGYKYKFFLTKEIADIKYFTSLYFNDQYPIESKIIKIEIPNWLEIELKEMNFEGYDIKKTVSNTKKNSKIHTYTLSDVSAMSSIKNAFGPSYIYPHLLILPKTYTKNAQKQALFNETKDLYNWYQSLVKQLKNDVEPFKNKVLALTKETKNDEEKIKNIYYWVQDNIRYIAFEDGIAGFKPDEASNVFTKRYGDCKGMANLTKHMLIEAGFDARLVWIGTKRIAYDYSTPNLSVDNHMICALIKDGKTIFLDGTESYNPFGEYAYRIQGKEALIENGKEFILKKVPEANVAFNKAVIDYSFTLVNEDLIGTVSKKYYGERRTELLQIIHTLKTDKKQKSLKRYLNQDNTNLLVTNIKTSDLEDREISLDLNYHLAVKNSVSSFGDEIYINLDLDKELSSFKLDKRKLDYIFSSKRMVSSTTSLIIPENYKIVSLPKNIAIDTEDFSINISFTQKENLIIYKKIIKIKNAIIKKTDFKTWNDFNDKLTKTYNEQIILNKK